jgi:hypothetical protein
LSVFLPFFFISFFFFFLNLWRNYCHNYIFPTYKSYSFKIYPNFVLEAPSKTTSFLSSVFNSVRNLLTYFVCTPYTFFLLYPCNNLFLPFYL